jgi:transcription termination factor NusB
MLNNKGEYVLEFIKSLDKEYEFNFSDNLFLISYYSFDIPLLPKDIMRMAKTFEFENTNYIKKSPDVFEACLNEVISENTGSVEINLKKYITKTELKKINNVDTAIFANSSLMKNSVPVPRLADNFKLKKEMNVMLEAAHERTKQKLASMRKEGTIIEEAAPKKTAAPPPVLDKADVMIKRHGFDKSKINEAVLYIRQKEAEETTWVPTGSGYYMGQSTIDKYPILQKHYGYQDVIQENYARRNEDVSFLKKAVDACKKQIDISAEAAYWFYAENEVKQKSDAGLPVHTGYQQLCIICEKQGFFDEVINIAEQAREEGWRGDWDSRIEKARKKLENPPGGVTP